MIAQCVYSCNPRLNHSHNSCLPPSPPSASLSRLFRSTFADLFCSPYLDFTKDGAKYTEGDELQFYGQDMQGRDVWASCVVVTVNAHAEQVQYNQRTGKAEHYGSYLIHVGEPGAPDPRPMDLIYEQQLQKSKYNKLGF